MTMYLAKTHCVLEVESGDGHFLLMSATNTQMVQFASGQLTLTAVLQFVMRWIPDLSVAMALTVG